MANATKTGLPRNTEAALAYLFGWITGLIFLVVEKDKFVRFHAMQSVVVFGGLHILSIILGMTIILAVFDLLIFPLTIVLWVVLMWKAYQGEEFVLPVVGQFAKDQVAKMS